MLFGLHLSPLNLESLTIVLSGWDWEYLMLFLFNISDRFFISKCCRTMVFWVFGYGSLVWNPGFKYDEKMIGYIKDYRRVFDLGKFHTLILGFGHSIIDFCFTCSYFHHYNFSRGFLKFASICQRA